MIPSTISRPTIGATPAKPSFGRQGPGSSARVGTVSTRPALSRSWGLSPSPSSGSVSRRAMVACWTDMPTTDP
jgi:hypothetical protein